MYIIVLIAAFLFVSWAIGYSIILAYRFFFVKKKHPQINPYIQSHLVRRQNDIDYEDYLKWMDKNNYSLPIDKNRTTEELRFENEYREYLKK